MYVIHGIDCAKREFVLGKQQTEAIQSPNRGSGIPIKAQAERKRHSLEDYIMFTYGTG